jgi:hypothetical protein
MMTSFPANSYLRAQVPLSQYHGIQPLALKIPGQSQEYSAFFGGCQGSFMGGAFFCPIDDKSYL